ncbi:pyridoxal phosphate-dependent aminotransferase [Umezawaea sp. Da 62-37]|uniref:pyridoxal phosphate-dependent aminotransferase n=1 Tax=Umezawaea sp. Da 62-37 TaxID=3075927 RepID=UPI0028F73889|nr:pyridoxal phosphate-dependent aminotransferase [Umezawaea sp. Da 62-37]WNV87570.1 pyridoxal phosphate-dependent aminotransferase [Umezawaea sp. Da 62-37]
MAHPPAHRSPTSTRTAGLTGNSLTELFVMARRSGAVDLAVGTPGFPATSEELIDGATRAMRAGRNQYEHPAGDFELRRQIADMLGDGADPEREITVTAGATEALYIALMSTLDAGDEVVLFSPGYEQLAASAALVGAKLRFVRLHGPEWRYDSAELAAAFTPRTRAVLLNTPANPTGRVLSREEMEEIGALCERWDATVICDEVYRSFVFDGREHVSATGIPAFTGRNVVIGSLSKSHAVSGWRLGFLRSDPVRTETFRRVHELTTNGTAAPLQAAAGSAARSVDLDEVRREMSLRRDLAQEVFSGMGMKFAPVEGGIFLFADISPLTGGREDCKAFAHGLLERAGVLLAPGAPFFGDPADGRDHVRIAFNRTAETLREAERRITA